MASALFVCYVLRETMVAMEEILIRKNEWKVTWILQYGFRSCHNSVIAFNGGMIEVS